MSSLIAMSPSYHGNRYDDHAIISEGCSEAGNNPSANEIISGPLTLCSPSHRHQKVTLSIFRSSVDHFALVYPDNRRKLIAVKPAGCINLRGVTCEEIEESGVKGFTLRPKKCDTSSAALIFLCEDDTSSFSRWMSALEPSFQLTMLGQRRIPRQCSLPSVEEEE